jgi:transposase
VLWRSSPYDPEASYGIKRTTEWIGYKVHFPEVCSHDVPHLITNVDAVAAYSADAEYLPRGQDVLAKQGLLLARQFVASSTFSDMKSYLGSSNDHRQTEGLIRGSGGSEL